MGGVVADRVLQSLNQLNLNYQMASKGRNKKKLYTFFQKTL